MVGALWEVDVADIPGIVFQEPGGGEPGKPEKTRGAKKAPKPASAPVAERPVVEPVEEAAPAAAPEASGEPASRRRPAVRKAQGQTFPVHVVRPHPLAFERAQEIIEENDSYTKILPGDEPGTVIVR